MATYTGLAGVSSLGVALGYAAESTAGTKPAAFTALHRINSIGGITISPETIDASALEDYVEKSVAGRASTGGTWTVSVNITDDTIEEWEDVIDAYNALSGGKQMWFEVTSDQLTDGFFVIAQPPQSLPMPEIGQNELLTMDIELTIVDYKGSDTKVTIS